LNWSSDLTGVPDRRSLGPALPLIKSLAYEMGNFWS